MSSTVLLLLGFACAGCDPGVLAAIGDGGTAAEGGLTPDGGADGGAVATAQPDGGVTYGPPLSYGGWTFYDQGQGLSATPSDVSADEGGNVYVAGGDAVYVKTRGAAAFTKAVAGLTTNCDAAQTVLCPVVSVAGGDPGGAVVGFQGLGTDNDDDPLWQQQSGGADVIAYDGVNVTRVRHVLIATPPGVVKESPSTFALGRRKGRQVLRAVFNHLPGLHHGDAWLAGTHVGFSVLFANPAAEGWLDYPNQYPDSLGVWEHDHPAVEQFNGDIETGDYYGVALDPTTGDPWAGNEYRTASLKGYGSGPGLMWNPLWPPYDPTNQLSSYLDVWPDGTEWDIDNPAWKDDTEALAFCDDGSLAIGSSTLGLALRTPAGQLSYLSLPAGLGNSVYALACDPSDGSFWVGFGWGGLGRLLPDGSWSLFPTGFGAPAFAGQPVRSIQIDRWASPRIVYFAHLAGASGPAGGVTAYQGP